MHVRHVRPGVDGVERQRWSWTLSPASDSKYTGGRPLRSEEPTLEQSSSWTVINKQSSSGNAECVWSFSIARKSQHSCHHLHDDGRRLICTASTQASRQGHVDWEGSTRGLRTQAATLGARTPLCPSSSVNKTARMSPGAESGLVSGCMYLSCRSCGISESKKQSMTCWPRWEMRSYV